MAVPTLGRPKNGEKMLSQTWEEQKISRAAFPNPWKNKKYRWELFQPLGRAVFLVFHSSNPLDEQFFLFFIHPTPWTSDFSCFSFIRGLGRAVFPVFRSSEASDEQFFPFFIHPRPRTICFSDFLLIRGLGRAFQCVAFHQSVCCLV